MLQTLFHAALPPDAALFGEYHALIVAIRDLAMENGCTVLATARLSEISEALMRAIKRREESSNDER